MTGTFFRSGQDALAMHAILSRTIYKVTSQQLLDWGYLVPVHAVFVPPGVRRLTGVENNFITGHGKHGIHEHRERNQLVAQVTLMLTQVGRRVLVLVGTKKQGYQIKSILNSLLPPAPERAEFQRAEFVSTDMKRPVQTRVLESFDQGQEVQILIGTTILGEGVDLPSSDAMVLARGERAEVSLTQAMYRVCTAQPGKNNAILVDFADRHHRKLLEHSQERLRVYYAEPTFHVQILDSAQQFPGWLQSIVPRDHTGSS
jgi:superfamily II DNA or RNA helicase